MQRKFANTSRGQLHYREHGQGPALVLLQTIPFSSEMFVPLMQAIGGRFTCYAIDLMGYGHSDNRSETWLVEDFAANVEEALDILGLSELGIVSGHFSAMVSLLLCQHRASDIKGLVVDGVAGWSSDEAASLLAARRRLPEPPLGVEEELAELWRGGLSLMKKLDPELQISDSNRALIGDALLAHIHNLLGPSPYDATFRCDVQSLLTNCPVSALLLSSDTDTQRRFHSENLSRLKNGSEYVFAGVNPLYQLDKPSRAEEYGSVISSFFNAHGLVN